MGVHPSADEDRWTTHRGARAEVWQDADLLRATIENATDAIVMTDGEGTVIAWNRAAAAMFGWKASDIVGRSVLELMPERFRAARRADFERAIAGEPDSVVGTTKELIGLHADGHELPIELSLSDYRADGRIVLTALIRDLSERVRTRAELQDKERRLLEAEQLGSHGHYVFEVPADHWTSSPGLDQVFGIGDAHPRTRAGWLQIVHPDDRPDMEVYLREHVLQQHHEFRRRYRIVRQRDEQVRWVEGIGRLAFDARGEPCELIGTIQDVTERVQHELELERFNEEQGLRLRELRCLYRLTEELHRDSDLGAILRTAVGLIPDGFSEPDGIEVRIAFDDHDVASSESLADTVPWLSRRLEVRGAQGVIEVRCRGLGGRLRCREDHDEEDGEFLDAVTKLLAGRIERHLARTERSELRRQYLEAQKMEAIGTLAGGIAHDFNNVLTAVMSNAQLARMDLPEEGGPVQEAVDEVIRSAERAKELVAHILSVARNDAQERRPVELTPLVKETVKMLRAMIPSSIEIEASFCSQPLVVHADPTQMRQVLLNLATNAAQAMEGEGGVLSLGLAPVTVHGHAARSGAEPPAEYARLTVADTGYGMDPGVVDRIFEPYFTTKAQGRGTGLGLAVVRGIVSSADGRVRVKTTPGEGSSFFVDLPLVDEAGDRSSVPAREVSVPGGTERVLLVDDEPTIVRATRRMLRRLGYDVRAAHSSDEALRLFHAAPHEVDLVLTDLTMPGLGGYELAAAIREERPQLPVVLCSGMNERRGEPAERPSVDGFIRKPFRLEELAATLRDALDRAATGEGRG